MNKVISKYYLSHRRDAGATTFSRSQTPVWERSFAKLRFACQSNRVVFWLIVKQSFEKRRYEAGAS
ncbi:MAG: hypothetical protein IH899_19355 [Planctomycetes bacterium]|nr:hypothetical protein [Planctomycetota bacterium]